jgi:hypothetical protein
MLDFLSNVFETEVSQDDIKYLVYKTKMRKGKVVSLFLEDRGIMLGGNKINIEKNEAEKHNIDLDELTNFVIDNNAEVFRLAEARQYY